MSHMEEIPAPITNAAPVSQEGQHAEEQRAVSYVVGRHMPPRNQRPVDQDDEYCMSHMDDEILPRSANRRGSLTLTSANTSLAPVSHEVQHADQRAES